MATTRVMDKEDIATAMSAASAGSAAQVMALDSGGAAVLTPVSSFDPTASDIATAMAGAGTGTASQVMALDSGGAAVRTPASSFDPTAAKIATAMAGAALGSATHLMGLNASGAAVRHMARLSLPAQTDPWPLWTDPAPVITRGYTLNVSGTNYNSNAPQFRWNSGKLSYIGATLIAGTTGANADAGINRSFAFDPTNTTRMGSQYRYRFGINSPEFAFHYAGGGSDFALMIDGKLIRPPTIPTGLNTGGGSYNGIKVALDTLTTDQEVQSWSINAAGTGYAEGDIVTLSGGTASTATTFVVTRVASGVVNSLSVVERGRYSSTPTSPASTTTSAAGTGLTLTPVWRVKRLNKNRTVELLLPADGRLIGVSVGASYDAWPLPAKGPKLLVVGDIITEGSVTDWVHGVWWINAARRLGFDHYAAFGLGSTGWVATNGNTRSNYVQRLADVIAWAPDVLIVTGSSNDGTGTGVQAAATQFWNDVKAALPNCQCIAMAPWTGTTGAVTPQANADANKAAALAAGVPYIDSYVDGVTGWLRNGANNAWVLAQGDTIHPQQLGHDYYGLRAANELRAILAA